MGFQVSPRLIPLIKVRMLTSVGKLNSSRKGQCYVQLSSQLESGFLTRILVNMSDNTMQPQARKPSEPGATSLLMQLPNQSSDWWLTAIVYVTESPWPVSRKELLSNCPCCAQCPRCCSNVHTPSVNWVFLDLLKRKCFISSDIPLVRQLRSLSSNSFPHQC